MFDGSVDVAIIRSELELLRREMQSAFVTSTVKRSEIESQLTKLIQEYPDQRESPVTIGSTGAFPADDDMLTLENGSDVNDHIIRSVLGIAEEQQENIKIRVVGPSYIDFASKRRKSKRRASAFI